MKTKSPLQILNAELNTCKANAPREKVMVAGGWFIKETAEQTKKDLKEFKAFVKEKFRQQASDLVVYFGHSRQKAEAAALETARSRIKCWKEAQAYSTQNFAGLVALCAAVLTSSFLKDISAHIENDPKGFLDSALSVMKKVNEEFKTNDEVQP